MLGRDQRRQLRSDIAAMSPEELAKFKASITGVINRSQEKRKAILSRGLEEKAHAALPQSVESEREK